MISMYQCGAHQSMSTHRIWHPISARRHSPQHINTNVNMTRYNSSMKHNHYISKWSTSIHVHEEFGTLAVLVITNHITCTHKCTYDTLQFLNETWLLYIPLRIHPRPYDKQFQLIFYPSRSILTGIQHG